jgi:hypothetical protein
MVGKQEILDFGEQLDDHSLPPIAADCSVDCKPANSRMIISNPLPLLSRSVTQQPLLNINHLYYWRDWPRTDLAISSNATLAL